MLLKKIVGVLLFVGCVVGVGIGYYYYVKAVRGSDDAYRVVAIVQSCSEPEMLPTSYLAELMNLSADASVNLYHFDVGLAQERLLASPLIEEARVKKVPPGTVFVDYVVRKPIALLVDVVNAGIDESGVIIPLHPFFRPKRLPEMVLGLSELSGRAWGTKVKDRRFALACEVLQRLRQHGSGVFSNVLRVDVSKAYVSSLGRRQIVIMLEDRVERDVGGQSRLFVMPRILRLSSKGYWEGLTNYVRLHDHLLKQNEWQDDVGEKGPLVHLPASIIDLRLPHLGFLGKEGRN